MSLVGTTLLERYFLRELAGSGGMADVFLAWDKLRSARLAVKMLRQDLAGDERFFNMFNQEAEVLRRLEHPNIVRLYDFCRDGDLLFIVMDWVEGSNLRQAVLERKAPFGLGEVSAVLEPVCSALHYAHQNEIYHCDVKPANIMLHADGRVLLSDFGVARLAGSGGGGTPPYMAPEQFSDGPVDPRTDVYALGVTIYELLSGGQVPFRGDSPNSIGTTLKQRIAWEHLNLPLPPLRKHNPAVPEAVEQVVQSATAKEAAQRYPTVMVLRDAYERACPAGTSVERLQPPRPPAARPVPSQPVSKPVADRQVPKPAPGPAPERQRKAPAPARAQAAGKTAAAQPGTSAQAGAGRAMHLLGRSGEWAGRTIPVPRGGLTIGRGAQNSLRLAEPSVSRVHAAIICGRKGVYLRDENSSLGTYVNGARISGPVLLKNGDIIQLGYYQLFEWKE